MIKELREKKGLTQSELAKLLKLNKSHVSRMERKVKGYRASYETIKLLAKHLDECPIKIFIFFADIDCGYIKETYSLRKHIKCEYDSCKNVEVIEISTSGKIVQIRHIKRKNIKSKRRLRLQIRSTYRNHNIKFRD
jgi:transcriptional regulator with XRE-family HTH domain